MAVAVKNKREATSTSVLDRLPVCIALGVLYIVLSVGIVFPFLARLWWEWLGLSRGSTGAWLLLIAIGLAAATGLTLLGGRLLAARTNMKGLRAGIALGVVGIFAIALLTQWAGTSLAEGLLARGMSWRLGAALAIGFGVVLLVLGGTYLLSDRSEKVLTALEDQGWFNPEAYKRSQGLRVRRGTLLGVLVLAGAGIWLVHLNLAKQGGDWMLNVPFTAKAIVTAQTVGDNPELQKALEQQQQQAAEAWQKTRTAALETLTKAEGKFPHDLRSQLDELAKQEPKVRELLAKGVDKEEPTVSAQERANLEQAIAALETPEPDTSLKINPFDLRDLNERFTKNYVKIKNPGDDPYNGVIAPDTGKDFETGQVVPHDEWERQQKAREEKQRQLREDKKPKGNPDLVVAPTESPVAPAKAADTEHTQLVLMKQMAFTLPVILALLALWLGWRLVNMPVFADFLIATEAELNKVSWPTQKHLIQDTIVVLTTVILLAVTLFLADVLWSRLLTGIGVLQPPPKDTSKTQEQPW